MNFLSAIRFLYISRWQQLFNSLITHKRFISTGPLHGAPTSKKKLKIAHYESYIELLLSTLFTTTQISVIV